MIDPASIAAALGIVGGLGGLAAFIRARSQNTLDEARAGREVAETEALEVRTARELISEMRAEMDRKVQGLEREIGRLHGRLEAALEERDKLREIEMGLREENRSLRTRIDELERQVRQLELENAAASAAVTVVHKTDGPTKE